MYRFQATPKSIETPDYIHLIVLRLRMTPPKAPPARVASDEAPHPFSKKRKIMEV